MSTTSRAGPERDGVQSLTVDLFAPGMTALHRVGVAGLAMTLKALADDPAARRLSALGSWTLSDRDVRLTWDGDGRDFFSALMHQSFRLTRDGLISFPALGDPLDHLGNAIVLHEALLGTFLQHPRTRKGTRRVSISIDVDGEAQVYTFLPLEWYAHQRVEFDPSRPLKVAGWLYPGGVVRHVQATNATSLAEAPPRALALLFAPVGALYFRVHRRTARVRPQYCLVIPDVADLTAYAQVRQRFLRQGVARSQVAGAAEAAVRVLAELEAAYGELRRFAAGACSIAAFGRAAWSQRQNTRVECFTLSGVERGGLVAYRAANEALPPHLVTSPDPRTAELRTWWDLPQVPDLVARNAMTGAPWWRGFADLWKDIRESSTRAQRPWALRGERGGLHEMVVDPRTMPDGPEARVVRACQEAWRRRLGELGERSRRQGSPFRALASREYERLRISFARCKNAAMLRQTMTDFWARAGVLPPLQEGWPDILPLLQSRWQEARDLALLALASYQPQTTEERAALTGDVATGQEEAT